ncbi:MAG: hypothetical protein PHV49_05330 [Alistipes sp.]|nr:hypothetical protein [Alistipes sp.]
MMRSQVIYNGEAVSVEELGLQPREWMAAYDLYHSLHVHRFKPYHPVTHLDVMARTVRRLYGRAFRMDAGRLCEEVERLLHANHASSRSCQVEWRIFPQGLRGDKDHPEYLMEIATPLFDQGYVMGCSRPLLGIYTTGGQGETVVDSALLQQIQWGRERVTDTEVQCAVAENSQGVLTQIDGEPLFLVFESEVVTTPLASGAVDTVLRRLVRRACATLHLTFTELPLCRSMLTECDEAFTVTPQGVVSLLGFEEHRYFNLTARRLSDHLTPELLP